MIRYKLPSQLNSALQFLTQPVLILLWTGFLAYGVFIPLLHYFWDDMAIHWIASVFGPEGLTRYFSTNRPVWGWFYRQTTSLLGDSPWLWQAFGLFWRWAAAVGLYLILRELWKGRKEPALWAGLLLMVYPGFGQQYIAMVYGHFFLILSAFLFSLYFSLRAMADPGRRFGYTGAALVLSAVNLFSMEYFYMLELLRPMMFWIALKNQPTQPIQPVKRGLSKWLPYLAVLIAASVWRIFIFGHQTENYQPSTLQSFLDQPLAALGGLLLRVVQDFWTTQVLAWANVLRLPELNTFGIRSLFLVIGLGAIILIFLSLVFLVVRRGKDETDLPVRPDLLQVLVLGLLAFLLAGIPFWITDLPVNLVFPYDRFNIPFMLSFCLIWTAILFALPLSRNLRSVMLIVLVSLATVRQVQTGIQYQRDWEQQARFFWQLTWRAPSIERGTVIFAHELPLTYFSDNSLTAALNWIYDPAGGANPDAIRYALYYPTIRVGEAIEDLQPGQVISHDLLVGSFRGNTSQSLALFFQPPACLRILDPEIEPDNWMVPLQVRDTIHLSDLNRILPEPQTAPPPGLYGTEPGASWCMYFEKADLARQYDDWTEVVRLAEIAFSLEDYPNDPAERMPFIEGYAHTGSWQDAQAQTGLAAEVSPVIQPALCRLWQRIDREAPPGLEHDQAVESVFSRLGCRAAP